MMETTVQVAVSLSLAGLGSSGTDAVRVPVTETCPSDSRDSGTWNDLALLLPSAMVP